MTKQCCEEALKIYFENNNCSKEQIKHAYDMIYKNYILFEYAMGAKSWEDVLREIVDYLEEKDV